MVAIWSISEEKYTQGTYQRISQLTWPRLDCFQRINQFFFLTKRTRPYVALVCPPVIIPTLHDVWQSFWGFIRAPIHTPVVTYDVARKAVCPNLLTALPNVLVRKAYDDFLFLFIFFQLPRSKSYTFSACGRYEHCWCYTYVIYHLEQIPAIYYSLRMYQNK
jgi:hypothetical protein